MFCSIYLSQQNSILIMSEKFSFIIVNYFTTMTQVIMDENWKSIIYICKLFSVFLKHELVIKISKWNKIKTKKIPLDVCSTHISQYFHINMYSWKIYECTLITDRYTVQWKLEAKFGISCLQKERNKVNRRIKLYLL